MVTTITLQCGTVKGGLSQRLSKTSVSHKVEFNEGMIKCC